MDNSALKYISPELLRTTKLSLSGVTGTVFVEDASWHQLFRSLKKKIKGDHD